jgi:twitching motility protein PilT
MNLEALIASANGQGASDLHLEPGLPAAARVRGVLCMLGGPLAARALFDIAKSVIGPEHWPRFVERRSFDLSKSIGGVRCRINVLQTSRGVGLAIRLLSSFQATIEKLNLHPGLQRLVAARNGLILASGPTGCGKSSTMAALIQEINLSDTRHVITIESPIEYLFRPRLAYIRQREVGRDTPSFEQGLLDALREDPDVLMVGEVRDPETMRLTLSASETGHLVLTTVHSSTCAEALQRIVSSFPSDMQGAVRAQLADCLVAVICQRLHYRPDLKIRVPECEILLPTMAVKNFIRTGDFFKLVSAMEMGAEHGMWTFQRYQTWLESKKAWHFPFEDKPPDSEPDDVSPEIPVQPPAGAAPKAAGKKAAPGTPGAASKSSGPIEIEPVEGGLDELLRKFEGQ